MDRVNRKILDTHHSSMHALQTRENHSRFQFTNFSFKRSPIRRLMIHGRTLHCHQDSVQVVLGAEVPRFTAGIVSFLSRDSWVADRIGIEGRPLEERSEEKYRLPQVSVRRLGSGRHVAVATGSQERPSRFANGSRRWMSGDRPAMTQDWNCGLRAREFNRIHLGGPGLILFVPVTVTRPAAWLESSFDTAWPSQPSTESIAFVGCHEPQKSNPSPGPT